MFIRFVETIQNAVTMLAERNTLSIEAPKIFSTAIYTEEFTINRAYKNHRQHIK